MESECGLSVPAEIQREEERMSVDHLLLPVCQCRRETSGAGSSGSATAAAKSSSSTLHAAAAGLTAGWPAPNSARRLVPRGKRGRELCALSGRSGSRRAGSHFLSVGPAAAAASSIRTQGVWRGSETKISLARCLAAATYCLLLRCLLVVVAARMYSGSAAHPPPNMQCRSFPLAA